MPTCSRCCQCAAWRKRNSAEREPSTGLGLTLDRFNSRKDRRDSFIDRPGGGAYLTQPDAQPDASNPKTPRRRINISAHRLNERNVHLGDVFRVGSCVLQVSQPRSPCWKINHRFDAERMSMYVAQERITGWYYRVIEPGLIQAGDCMELQDRQTDRFSVDQFWQVQLAHRPSIDDLNELIAVAGLASDWKRRMGDRAKWLQNCS
ncbi:MOSC domain-containing protein [Variovorax sp. LjRoot178]|uniref:MOSC domain-containing protein n=1 Tax=Variovorax sp. LjRoot178 TaxID=3342277 RepID=UPI003F50E0D2